MAALPGALIERALNAAVERALADSARARELTALLAGRRLAIRITGTAWTILLESTGSTLKAGPLESEHVPDATLIGTPLSLLALSGADPQSVIQRGAVRIEGDTEIAQQFRELALLLAPDVESVMGDFVGRGGAHLLMRGLQGAAAWTRRTAWTGMQNLSEYLAHERGELVSTAESEHVMRGIDELREQVDRLEARIAQLEQGTHGTTGGEEPV
jgi:ubiquinone biosynthesis accessory factor UbiJ